VHGYERQGQIARFDVDSSELADAVARLTEAGLVSLQSSPPTLEELFLRHYGDDLRRDLGVETDDRGHRVRRRRA
jgi:ABC-2 type transport system ATP-binding protein